MRSAIGRRTAAFIAASSVLFLSVCIIQKRGESGSLPQLEGIVRAAWLGLDNTKNLCGDFDYFPDGGMRIFYCHLVNFISYERFVSMMGVAPFRSGPHSREFLNFDSRKSFGYYNPDFVRRLGDLLIPGGRDSSFREKTQRIYDGCIRKLARIFYVTNRKLMSNPGYLEREKRDYLRFLDMNRNEYYDYEKYFYFMNPRYFSKEVEESYLMDQGFDGGWDGNVVKTCVAFWIRRSIDGTDKEFYQGLVKLLAIYDSGFLRSH